MKKVIFFALLLPALAFGQEAVVPVIPSWIDGVLSFISAIPAVGPILAEIVKYSGIVSGILTALSAILIGVEKAIAPIKELVDKEGKVAAILTKVSEAVAKILPYLQYLSMFNVQKKK